VRRLAACAVRLFVTDPAPAIAAFDAGALHLVVETGDSDERGRPLVGHFSGLSFRTDDVQREHERLRHSV
jgi:hypothetical protein